MAYVIQKCKTGPGHSSAPSPRAATRPWQLPRGGCNRMLSISIIVRPAPWSGAWILNFEFSPASASASTSLPGWPLCLLASPSAASTSQYVFYNVYRRRKTKQSEKQKAESGKWKNKKQRNTNRNKKNVNKKKKNNNKNNQVASPVKSCGFACGSCCCWWCCMLLGRWCCPLPPLLPHCPWWWFLLRLRPVVAAAAAAVVFAQVMKVVSFPLYPFPFPFISCLLPSPCAAPPFACPRLPRGWWLLLLLLLSNLFPLRQSALQLHLILIPAK